MINLRDRVNLKPKILGEVRRAKRDHCREERGARRGFAGRKTGTDHTTVVHDHRHGNSGRAHGPTNKEDHVCARRRDVRRQGFRPANPGRAAPEARERGFRRTKNFG